MKTKKKQRKNKENKNKTKTKRKQQEIEHPKTHLYKSIVLKHVLQTRFEQNTFSKQNESIFKQNNVLVDPWFENEAPPQKSAPGPPARRVCL